jgi:hypothetical protein
VRHGKGKRAVGFHEEGLIELQKHLPFGYEQYLAVWTTEHPAGGGRVFVRDHRRAQTHLLQAELAAVLRACDRLRTGEDHLKAFRRRGWENSGRLGSCLQELLRLGLLQSRNDLIESTQAASSGKQPLSLQTIAFITRGRPEMLGRGLKSFVDNNRRYGRSPRYLVLDDGKTRKSRRETMAVLQTVAREKGVEVAYIGTVERKTLSAALDQALRRAGVPRKVLEFAINGLPEFQRTVGANRNMFLLATTGEPALMTDDDVVCRLVSTTDHEGDLEVCAVGDPTEFQPFGSRDELLSKLPARDEDVLDGHERLLGRPVGSMLTGQTILSRVDPRLAYHLTEAQSHILATLPGFYGDSGMSNPRWVLALEDEQRKQVLASRKLYKSACTSREILRFVRRPTLSTTSSVQAHQVGLDNRSLLPAFFPILRNQDGLFAVTLRACTPAGLVGHFPQAVAHLPMEERAYAGNSLVNMAPRMAETLILIIADCETDLLFDSPEKRISSLGRRISEIAALKPSSFQEYLQVQWLRRLSKYCGYLEDLLGAYDGKPGYWAADVRAHLASCRSFLLEDGAVAPADLCTNRTEEEALALCRDLTSRFGELLYWWPAIVSAASVLRLEGRFPIQSEGTG